jgi:PII-like signaling protein
MSIPEQAVLLRIFLGEDDRFERQPLYEAIVMKARQMGLAGATVLRGPMGFGSHSKLHSSKILRLSQDLPLVIEIVDAEDRIDPFVTILDGMMTGGLVTIEQVQVRRYGPPDSREAPSS